MSATRENRAAVLVVFREGVHGREVLLMRRKERDGDPWSGQISFPGGHAEPEDPSLLATALREAREEVGLEASELDGTPTLVGERSPGNLQHLIVSVFVGHLRDGRPVTLAPGPEASEVHWVLVSGLRTETRTVALPRRGIDLEVEGYAAGELYIWGLTYRILSDYLSRGRVGPD